MKKALFLLIPAVFRIFGSLDAIKITCTKTYKAENGRSCYPCSPGFHKLSDCDKDNETAICTKCDTGRYQPDCDNSPECLRCSSSCLVGQEKVKECSDTSNIECQCTSGLFWQPNKDNPDGGQCSKHSLCLAGEGVLEKGTPFKNTTCGQCQEGVTYSDKKSFDRCTTCSTCNNTIAQKCSLTNDTICGHKSSGSSTEKDGGVVKFIVIGVIILVIIVVIVVAAVLYRREKKRRDSEDVPDVELTRVGSSEQSNIGNDSNEPEVADEQNQEVSENAGHVVSEHRIALYDRNGYLGSQQTQQNLEQNNNDISDHRTTNVSENGVGSNYRNIGNNINFEDLVGNENYESSENTDVISTDVFTVLPTSSQGSDSSVAQIGNDGTHQVEIEQQCKDETNRKVVACPSGNSSVDTTVPEGSVQTDTDLTEKSMSVPQFDNTQTEEQTCLTDDEVWMEVFYFLGRHLVWNEFKSFFRWLVVKTNKTLSETKDAEIERVHSETGYACKESTYKLMELWKQSTSNASLHDVLSALSKLQLIQKCEKLTEMLQKKGVVFQTCNEHTESSTKHSLGEETSSQGEFTTKTMLPVNIQSDNQQMMELKGHISTL